MAYQGISFAARYTHDILIKSMATVRSGDRAFQITGQMIFVNQGIVALGGRLAVESEPGKGSVFTIKLPAVVSEAVPEAAAEAAADGAADEPLLLHAANARMLTAASALTLFSFIQSPPNHRSKPLARSGA